MKTNFYLTLSIAIIALSACKKDHKPIISPPKHDTAVYIAGIDGSNADTTIACYWRNGLIKRLTSLNSYASAIAAKDSNIYITGYIGFNPVSRHAVYWKNGKINYLSDGSVGSEATAITLSGTDVYIAGTLEKDDESGQAAYWKNGVLTTLSDATTTAYTTGIAVNGNDVYVTGYIYGPIYGDAPVYWKNGVMTKLIIEEGSADARATSVVVNGNDVYIAYYNNGTAYYLKNGVVTGLANGNTFGVSTAGITIIGNDVYIAGLSEVEESLKFTDIATYWKNNVPQLLHIAGETNDHNSTLAKQVTVFQNDVYVIGNFEFSATGITNAYYWKNGTPVKLSNDYSYANGIVGVTY